MTPKQFASLVKLTGHVEKDKAVLIGFYLHTQKELGFFSMAVLVAEMEKFGLSKPNTQRLKDNLLSAKLFIRSGTKNIKLHLKKMEELEMAYPEALAQSEEIITDETILPDSLLVNTRGYLVQVAKQINACYNHRIYDGCAMLMRRLTEMLIILTYQDQKREFEIKDSSGGYQPLSFIINHAQSNKVLNLSKADEAVLNDFRELGNYAAHGVAYNTKKVQLDGIKIPFRACVEALLYKSGVKK